MTDTPASSLATALAGNPAGWPEELLPLFEQAITVEYASLTRAGAPVTYPVTPYVGEDGLTLDVSTGLTYSAKAERARRNPKVALLYSDPLGSGLDAAPVVLVQGLATVRDADLQANTDRYVRLSMAKAPDAYEGQPKFLLRPHLDTGNPDPHAVVARGAPGRAAAGVDSLCRYGRAALRPGPSRRAAGRVDRAARRVAQGRRTRRERVPVPRPHIRRGGRFPDMPARKGHNTRPEWVQASGGEPL
jgi:hypothetical protein